MLSPAGQDRIPIIGGGGERRTLRIVARHADGCNFQGDVETIGHKIEVLGGHSRDAGGDPGEVVKKVLIPVVLGSDRAELHEILDRIRPRSQTIAWHSPTVGAMTVPELIERRELPVEPGVAGIYLRPRDLEGAATVARFAPVMNTSPDAAQRYRRQVHGRHGSESRDA